MRSLGWMDAQQAREDARETLGARKASSAFLKWARLLGYRLAMVCAFLRPIPTCAARRARAARERGFAQCHPNARNSSPARASGTLLMTPTALKCDASRSDIHLSEPARFFQVFSLCYETCIEPAGVYLQPRSVGFVSVFLFYGPPFLPLLKSDIQYHSQ